jgi:hypothetical protein
MKPRVTLRQALDDPQLLGGTLVGDTWLPWRVLLIAAMGEALTDDERVLFQQLTQRDHEPDQMVEEFAGVIGRRGGKTFAISVVAAYIGGLCEHPALVPGETGVVLVIAPDSSQAKICLDFCEAHFRGSPILSQLIKQRISDALILSNGIEICVRAASFRRLRGPTYIVVIVDEVAFLMTDDTSANPDTEIIGAVRPGLATTGGPLIMISSPYARRGELWTAYDRHFGAKGDPRVLVAQASSRTMNPSLSESVVARAYERDPAAAAAEYGAQFRTDIESYVSLEAVRAVVATNVYERPRQHRVSYSAFIDPSGGGSDAMTLACGHYDANREVAVLDCIRCAEPPFSPEVICGEFALVLQSYGLTSAVGDKFGGAWVKQEFTRVGIFYEATAEPKSLLYGTLLSAINSRRCDLLDNKKLIVQLTALERRTSRTGRGDMVDHPPGLHDDVANVVAGLVAGMIEKGVYNLDAFGDGSDQQNGDGLEGWRRMRTQAYIQSGGLIKLW